MRVRVLFAVLMLGVVGAPAPSHAEKVKTNQSARVYAKPGEQGKVIVKVKSGQTMTVLAKEGRWLKVRVSGRTGFVPRSKVDLPDDEEITRNTRRRPFVDGRGTKRGFGGEEGPDDRVGADATETSNDDASDGGGDDEGEGKPKKPKAKPKAKSGDDDEDENPVKSKAGGGDDDEGEPATADDAEPSDDRIRGSVAGKTTIYNDPDKESGESFKAKPGDVLFVGEKKGKFTFVETEEGDAGYVLTSKLEVDEGSSGGGGGGKRTRVIDLRARAGITFVQQAVRTAGGAKVWPDNYNIGSSSFNLALGAAYLMPYKKDYYLGGEIAYDFAKAIPGVSFDPDGPMGPVASSTTGFALHNFNLRAIGGYDLHKKNGTVVFGRLGYHYASFTVSDYLNLTKNTARLPQETLGAPTLGGALSIPRLTSNVGLRVSLDAILFGASVKQTKNLEDGSSPSAKGVNLGAGFTYRWKPEMDIQATYDLNYMSLSFGAPVATSMRMHTGTAVSRTDVNHTIAVGIAKAF